MPEQKQDILSQTLLRLEQELETFGNVQRSLKDAYDKLEQAKQEWDRLTKEQQQSALKLVDATQSAIDTTKEVSSQAKALTGALLPLAKAIENVNFPLRLDKIDMAASTQASTVATFQGTTERSFNDLRVEMEASKKSAKGITMLQILNIIVLLIGFAILYFNR